MAIVIPVTPQQAPSNFDEAVKNPGIAWLNEKGITLDQRAPKGTKFEDFWTGCIDFAHSTYRGICAYQGVHLELATSEVTIDHYQSKMSRPDLAYEWSNYRLASLGLNRIKGEKAVLDPFAVEEDWFFLELVSGRIFANPDLPLARQALIQGTIAKLGLDNARCRHMRAEHFKNYKEGLLTAEGLCRFSPFVFKEASRQGLL